MAETDFTGRDAMRAGVVIDMVGRRFGKLTVLSRAGSLYKRMAAWACACECGASVVVAGAALRRGDTRSCGCGAPPRMDPRRKGAAKAPERRAWSAMWTRCRNRRCRSFPNYGGRGITVCARWAEFSAFLADMGPRPSPNHSLDRINVNGNYEPGNCRWATYTEQQRNRRDNVFTVEIVREIRRRMDQGESHIAIAAELGRRSSSVLDIKLRRVWVDA